MKQVKTALAICALAGILTFPTQAATTDPVGYVNIDVAAGTGSSRATSAFALPLMATTDGTFVGNSTGRITGVTASTITSSGAGWSPGALSIEASPFLIKITSGDATGRIFVISSSTSNTADTLTISDEDAADVDLTALNIAVGSESGDTFQIFHADTLSSALGTPQSQGVLGGASAAVSDYVLLFDGSWRTYFYNTEDNEWQIAGLGTPSDNVIIRPETAIMYSRLADSNIPLTITGAVPMTERKALVSNSGVSFLSWGFPVEANLGTSGIESIPGWVSNEDVNIADQVIMLVEGTWRTYYHDGSEWKLAGLDTPSDSIEIPATGNAIINKKGSASGKAVAVTTPAYLLN